MRNLPYIRVYFRSDLEMANVKLRASLLKKKLSTYIRDLVVIDLHESGLKPFLDTKEGIEFYKRTGETPTIEDVGLPGAAEVKHRTPLTQEQIDKLVEEDMENEKRKEEYLNVFEEFGYKPKDKELAAEPEQVEPDAEPD